VDFSACPLKRYPAKPMLRVLSVPFGNIGYSSVESFVPTNPILPPNYPSSNTPSTIRVRVRVRVGVRVRVRVRVSNLNIYVRYKVLLFNQRLQGHGRRGFSRGEQGEMVDDTNSGFKCVVFPLPPGFSIPEPQVFLHTCTQTPRLRLA